jgi:hypothetical protein
MRNRALLLALRQPLDADVVNDDGRLAADGEEQVIVSEIPELREKHALARRALGGNRLPHRRARPTPRAAESVLAAD